MYDVTLDCNCITSFVGPPTIGEYAFCADHGDTEVFESHDTQINLSFHTCENGEETILNESNSDFHIFAVYHSPDDRGIVYFFMDREDGITNEGDNIGTFGSREEAIEAALSDHRSRQSEVRI